MPQTRIGISGWTYTPWRGTFYPKGLAQKRELEYASRQLNSIEINGSFYSLQRPQSYRHWYEQSPDDFVFSVKGGRFITHMKRLREVDGPVSNFFASGILRLNEKLGPILWQFPPNMRFDEAKFEAFFKLLPRDARAAANLAKKHDERMKGRSWTKTDENRPLRYAVEVRHNSFKDMRFIRLLRRNNIALVFADTAGRWPYMEDVTADFIYARLHGDEELYVSGYTDAALDWWASRLRLWRGGGHPDDPKCIGKHPGKKCRQRDVFVYFDNDVKVRAPYDAMQLRSRIDPGYVARRAEEEFQPGSVTETPRTRWPGFKTRKRGSTVKRSSR